ncbi:MAG: hypothetical protein QXH56_08460, partial [Thermoprotei archaeon]
MGGLGLLYERLEHYAKKYPTKTDFKRMLESICSSTQTNRPFTIELVRLNVSPTNFLGLSLKLVPHTQSDSGCTLFVSLHTARPQNKLNLKHVSYIEEVYALARSALNMRHPAFKTFFEKHFGPTNHPAINLGPHPPRTIDQLSIMSLSLMDQEGWKKVDPASTTTDIDPHTTVEDLASNILPDVTADTIETELGAILSERRWQHYTLLRTTNLLFVLSTNRYGEYTFGFSTGGKPKNYLKLKQYSLLEALCELLAYSINALRRHPHIYEAIAEYQQNAFGGSLETPP